MAALFQNLADIGGFVSVESFVLLAVGCLQMWSHIVCAIAQANLEVLVTEYLLIVAEDRIGELGVKGADGFQAGFRRRNKANGERIVRIGKPCSTS